MEKTKLFPCVFPPAFHSKQTNCARSQGAKVSHSIVFRSHPRSYSSLRMPWALSSQSGLIIPETRNARERGRRNRKSNEKWNTQSAGEEHLLATTREIDVVGPPPSPYILASTWSSFLGIILLSVCTYCVLVFSPFYWFGIRYVGSESVSESFVRERRKTEGESK